MNTEGEVKQSMIIDGNAKEKAAMLEYHKGNEAECQKLQAEFVEEFRREYAAKDHCPCTAACRYHGNCKECVAIHRAHQEHVPKCLQPLITRVLMPLSELSEHAIADEIAALRAK